MADKWSGPTEAASIQGLVDSAIKIGSERAASGERLQLSLVDVTQTNTNESVTKVETRMLYIPTEGWPASVFAAGVRKITALAPTSDALLEVLEGKQATFAVERQDFTGKDGLPHTMTAYRLVALESHLSPLVDDSAVLAYLNGKSPADAAKGRSQFSGTAYATTLATKAKTVEYFGKRLELVDGVYKIAVGS